MKRLRLLRKLPRWLRNPIWALRYRFDPKHQYNIVRTGLPPGYYDTDYRLLHAVMALVCEHVAAEGGVERMVAGIDDLRKNHQLWAGVTSDPSTWDEQTKAWVAENEKNINGHADRDQEALDIYLWWTHVRPAQHAQYENMLMTRYGGSKFVKVEGGGVTFSNPNCPDDAPTSEEIHAFQAALDATDQQMLHRVINIRPSLWT